jgi:hypothetical protein
VAGLATAGAGAGLVRAGTNGVFNAGDGAPYELWHDWTSLTGVDRVVAAGVLAANPHNTQPWRVVVDDNTVHLYSDPDRRMPANDASGREHYAGIGCALESMVVAAASAGLAPRAALFPEPEDPELVARLVLEPATAARAEDAELAAAISHRHTNRAPYTTRPIAGSTMETLDRQTRLVPGAGIRWITDPGQRAALGELYVEATAAIVADEEQSREAFSWFRSSREAVDEHRDGLTLDCQGLDDLTLILAKVLPAQSRSDGDDFWVRSTRDVHTATATAYGIITVGDVTDPAAQVTGGRLLTRMHLAATTRRLGLHHMNQITERIDRARATGRADTISSRWSGIVGRPASECLLSFRIGYPEREARPSPRRALADVVTS